MARSGCLPDADQLSSLLAAAGVRAVVPPALGPMGAPPPLRAPSPSAPLAPVVAISQAHVPTRPPAIAPRRSSKQTWTPPLDPHRDTAPPPMRADVSVPTFDPHDSLDARLAVFVDWLVGSTGASSAFVADGDGLPIVNRMAPEHYVGATAQLAAAQQLIDTFIPSAGDAMIALELKGAQTLQIVWATIGDAKFAVGMIVPRPLDRIFCDTVRAMVRAAINQEAA